VALHRRARDGAGLGRHHCSFGTDIRIAAVLSAGTTIAVARLDPWQLVVWFLD
jgi:hypothetical protein